MQGNRKRDTAPEMALRRTLHRMGLRYRVASRPEPGLRWTADIVFPRARLAIFVDGCFWHGCPEHFAAPRTNMSYWGPKILGNMARDVRVQDDLRSVGWVTLRFWEHEDMESAARLVREALDRLTEKVASK
jgi:DNA mismatch endonuclease (patch repair protein)